MELPDVDDARYSEAQLNDYFTHISLPSAKRRQAGELASASAQERLNLLATLQQHQLATVPWENLSLHYTAHRANYLDPYKLFQKIVGNAKSNDRGRPSYHGGYCMENNRFFATVLRSLGYHVVTLGARVFQVGLNVVGGWDHMNLRVTIEGITYIVDVGFGGAGPVLPLKLEDGYERANIAPARARITRKHLPQYRDEHEASWVYQYSKGTEAGERQWDDIYCFSDEEFLPRDYEVMNYFTSTHRSSPFVHRIVMTKFLLDTAPEAQLSTDERTRLRAAQVKASEEDDRMPNGSASANQAREELDEHEPVLIGTLVLTTHVKRRIGSNKSEKLEPEFESEEQRIASIEKWFHIDLGDDARAAIKGTAAEIGPKPF